MFNNRWLVTKDTLIYLDVVGASINETLTLQPHETIGWLFLDSTAVSLDEFIDDEKYFDVYPNPTTGILTIEGAEGIVSVYDIYGRMVLTANTNKLDISNAAIGIYFVRIFDEQGKVYSQKAVQRLSSLQSGFLNLWETNRAAKGTCSLLPTLWSRKKLMMHEPIR
ncbi:MAG TPA: T9SS type A sorting domain-containing protein [Flavobacteriales bacterium]|nr:T9SS type A sorting domain-containing protein [Flavobacteriales bacterium]HIO68511.1 T9SS type A sorting domain-containing protein [Flavobacteriales bacterium]